MKALSISGGSTKIGFLAGSAIELCKRNNYQIITGISAGSVISLLLAIDEFELLEGSILPIDTPDFFKNEPLNDKNNIKISAIWRILVGKTSLAEFTLSDLIRRIYTKEHHLKLQNSGKIVKVGAANLNLNQIEYCDISKVDYELAIKWVVASSSIPVTADLVKIGDYLYTDGGVLQHVGGLEAINSGATKLDVVFSRPEEMELSHDDINWSPKNILDVLFKTISIMSDNNSFNDKDIIEKTCLIKNIPLSIYYTPFKLTSGMYKMDSDLTKSWFELGREQVLNKY
jgi:predicted patatin/cPLA2 family phospholipase